MELKKRIDMEKTGMITAGSLGLTGIKNEKMGILVELATGILVGKNDGHGIPIYDWGKIKKDGNPFVNIQMTRQMLSGCEVSMFKKAAMKQQDYVVVAARGLLKSSMLDDILRKASWPI